VALAGSALSMLGIALGTYLTVAHYTTASVLACAGTGVINCTKVTTSSYSVLFGVPVALGGLLYFVAMLPLQLPWAWRSPSAAVRRARLVWSLLGVVAVLWLVYVELFRLDAICLYCTAVHVVTVVLFELTAVGTALTPLERPDVAGPDGEPAGARAAAMHQ
jgi:uncharacterized membrane protein